ncbi:MAG: Rnf-Nqr domain containing protein [Clostridia bacterium]|nr:Rnf-Nqr domain containing protein [Clostridia bacterium]MDR3644028.1 Rnf-Nqr domain containing protein [Clostridia bacterium]
MNENSGDLNEKAALEESAQAEATGPAEGAVSPQAAGEGPTASELLALLRRGITARNPVLVRALALAPVLFVSTTLKNGLLLAGVTLIVLILMSIVSSLIYTRIPAYLRAALLTLIAAAFVTPLCMLSNTAAPNVAASVGIFLPLVAVNGIFLSRAEHFDGDARLLPAVIDGAANGLGFALAIILLSVIREVLGSGMLYGRVLPGMQNFSFSFALMPAGGLFALAFLIAIVQFARQNRQRKEQKSAGRDRD